MVRDGAQRSLLSGTAWNLFGLVLPLVVAVVSIPLLIRLIGLDRFGFLALAWVLVGYTSLLDLGIGKAVIRTMAARLAQGDSAGALIRGRVGLMFLGLVGVVLCAGLELASTTLVGRVLKVPDQLRDEAVMALPLLAASLPFVMVTGGFVGVMSAYQDFKPMNLLRALLSLLTYLAPLALALAGHGNLPALMGSVLVVRLLGTLAYALACRRRYGLSLKPCLPSRSLILELFSLGGWMTVSNLVGPLISYLDRLLVGMLVPLRLVGVYSAPYDLVQRMLMVPYAMMGAWFPHAAAIRPRTTEAEDALRNVLRWLFCAMTPLTLIVCAVAYPAMTLWLGAEQGPQAAMVLQLLVTGLTFNAMAQGPATLILAAGHPRRIAIMHLAQLPVFVILLWLLTSSMGIVGTALAVSLRFALDAAAVTVLAWIDLVGQPAGWQQLRALVSPSLVFGVLLAAAQAPRGWAESTATALLAAGLFAGYAWVHLLRPMERERFTLLLRRRLGERA